MMSLTSKCLSSPGTSMAMWPSDISFQESTRLSGSGECSVLKCGFYNSKKLSAFWSVIVNIIDVVVIIIIIITNNISLCHLVRKIWCLSFFDPRASVFMVSHGVPWRLRQRIRLIGQTLYPVFLDCLKVESSIKSSWWLKWNKFNQKKKDKYNTPQKIAFVWRNCSMLRRQTIISCYLIFWLRGSLLARCYFC